MSSLRQTGPGLDELAGALERFAGDTSVSTHVASALADAGERLVFLGFTASRAPDGTPWAPLKRPRIGEGGVLVKSGELRDVASRPVVTAAGFVMTAPDPKRVHQHGYAPRNLPARPFYPGTRLPSTWETVMEAAADEALTRDLP